jgi:hypothetical protein
MLWPAAALAVFLLGFAVVYGSILQSRLEAGKIRGLDTISTELAADSTRPRRVMDGGSQKP